jgi:hypothetical protein
MHFNAHARLVSPNPSWRCGGRFVDLRQRLADADVIFSANTSPSPQAIKPWTKAERVDRPLAVVFDFGLIGTEDPMASLIHFQDSCTGWADIGLDRPQGR